MSAPVTPPIPAGWYPDPNSPGRGRYWDGVAWTDHVHVPGSPLPATPELKAPPGTDGTTVWVWLIILLPLVPLILLLLVPWGSLLRFDVAASSPAAALAGLYDVFLSPAYWAAIVLSYVIYGLSVFFAYRDHRELASRGVPRPFHWAFAFIGGAVYSIGRSVVVHRRTGSGHGPLWAEIGVIALSLVVSIVIVAMMFSGMGDMFRDLSEFAS